MDTGPPRYPRGSEPLRSAESQCLEVLLTDFTLRRNADGGLTLEVQFDDDVPTIRHRGTKQTLRRLIPDFESKASALQSALAEFVRGNSGSVFRHDKSLPFRFCSGGAIPLVALPDSDSPTARLRDYYCLRWRDIYPVGWNLANGGSENRRELLYPDQIISRELREEMLVYWPSRDPARKAVRGELAFGGELHRGHPDDELAWRLWGPVLARNWDWIGTEPVPLLPLPIGPDRVEVTFGESDPHVTPNVILNINALDLGIEIDRVVRMHLPPNSVICDGEILEGKLLNSIMGLFEKNRFDALLRSGAKEFFPDRFFFNGMAYDQPDKFARTVETFFRQKSAEGLRSDDDISDYEEAKARNEVFGLCPAARTLLERFADLARPVSPDPAASEADVFISFASQDVDLARKVNDFLQQHRYRPFLSDKYRSGSDYCSAINDALHRAPHFVAVASSIDHLQKEWLRYESNSFTILFNRGDKPGGRFLTLVEEISPNRLPLPYAHSIALPVGPNNSLEEALRALLEYLKGADPRPPSDRK